MNDMFFNEKKKIDIADPMAYCFGAYKTSIQHGSQVSRKLCKHYFFHKNFLVSP